MRRQDHHDPARPTKGGKQSVDSPAKSELHIWRGQKPTPSGNPDIRIPGKERRKECDQPTDI